jgi:hypothetical protein
LKLLDGFLVGLFRSQAAREAEMAFLRQQLFVLKRSSPARVRLRITDRLIFVWFYRRFPSLLGASVIFQLRQSCAGIGAVSGWIARQITEAFPWDEAPHYLIRDRGTSYGAPVTRRLRTMGIRDRPITPRSPWQNGYVERLIGSIRRDASTMSWCSAKVTYAICWQVIAPTITNRTRVSRWTRTLRSTALRRQSGELHQFPVSADLYRQYFRMA